MQIYQGKNISLIVATDKKNGIGKNNQLLWHLPKDLQFFKKTTSGHPIIMGRKTYDSIGKALPNRRNIVISRQIDLTIEGVEVYPNIDAAVAACGLEEEIFVIGGGEIYKQALAIATKIYLTKVDHQFDADTFFSELNLKDWKVIFEENHLKDEKHLYNFSFNILAKQ
jgi:dihydrofolate reductase